MRLRLWLGLSLLTLVALAAFGVYWRRDGNVVSPDAPVAVGPLVRNPISSRTLAHPEPPALGSTAAQVAVRDLADGSAVSLVPVDIVTSEHGTVRRVTDARGFLSLEPEWIVSGFNLEEGGYQVVYAVSSQVQLEGVLWVATRRTVSGRVVLLGSTDPSADLVRCKVEALVTGKVNPENPDLLLDPWTPQWLRAHGGPYPVQLQLDSKGAFTGLVPLMESAVVRATCDGYEPAWARLEAATRETRTSPIELVLRRGKIVRGQLVDRNGQPVQMRRVTGYVHVSPADAQTFQDLQAIAKASLGASRSASGKYDITYVVDLEPSADGKFEVVLPVAAGELQFVAYAAGRPPIRRREGDKESYDLGVLTLSEESPSTVTLLFKGIPLANAHLTLSDLTDTPVQTNVDAQLDSAGRMSGAWLEKNRAYWIIVREFDKRLLQSEEQFVDGIMVWDGRASVDLSELKATFDEVIPAEQR